MKHLYDVAAPLFKRDITMRYRGSVMGLAWTFLVPLLMLGVYAFVFGGVFRMRWSDDTSAPVGMLDFALVLFIGLIIHSYVSEVLTRSPTIVMGHVNLVKRVVFPLQILPVMTVSTALFQFFVSAVVFMVFQLAATGSISPGVLWLPVIVLPLTILLIGAAWVLASITVYIRDVAQIMGLISMVLLFMSPVFYPMSRLPEHLWPVFQLNPLTFIIEQSRRAVFDNMAPDFTGLAIYTVVASFAAALGYFIFKRLRRDFADVL